MAIAYYYPKMSDAYNHFMLSSTENWKSTIPPWVYLDWSAGTATGVVFNVDTTDVAYETDSVFGMFRAQDCVY